MRRRLTTALAFALAACAGPGAAAGAAAARGASSAPATRPAAADDSLLRLAVLRDSLQTILDRARADSAFPGAVAVIGTSDGVLATVASGTLDWAAASPPVDARTIWDLASLTKVVVLTTLVAQLVDEDAMALDAPLQRYLPEWRVGGAERVTVRHLLTHASGLPGWRPLYREADSRDAALDLVLRTPLDTVPGARTLYSDLGVILLGLAVERVAGAPLDDLARARIFSRLGMQETGYLPDLALRPRIAPTEFDPWRGRLVHGEVHDENAHRLGGVSAHAGLFSTADDLARFARAYLQGGTIAVLSPQAIATFTAPHDPALGNRALGWEKPTGRNSAGALMSPRAFGHTGFTGTSLWIDPTHDLFVILLTNRVNPTRENRRIGAVRQAVADAAVGVLTSSSSASGRRTP